jgi:hypothetical protein
MTEKLYLSATLISQPSLASHFIVALAVKTALTVALILTKLPFKVAGNLN